MKAIKFPPYTERRFCMELFDAVFRNFDEIMERMEEEAAAAAAGNEGGTGALAGTGGNDE